MIVHHPITTASDTLRSAVDVASAHAIYKLTPEVRERVVTNGTPLWALPRTLARIRAEVAAMTDGQAWDAYLPNLAIEAGLLDILAWRASNLLSGDSRFVREGRKLVSALRLQEQGSFVVFTSDDAYAVHNLLTWVDHDSTCPCRALAEYLEVR